MAEEEKINTDIDDWLNDLDDEDGANEELNQADIDSLLGADTEMADNGDSGIEALGEELDQSDIDSLLAGAEEEKEEERASPITEESTIDQEEMDKLFSLGEVKDAENEEDVAILSALGDENDLQKEAFTLEPGLAGETANEKPRGTFRQPAAFEPEAEKKSSGEEEELPDALLAARKGRKPFYRSSAALWLSGFLLTVLLGGGYYFYRLEGEKRGPAIVVENKRPPARLEARESPREAEGKAPAPAEQPNREPQALSEQYAIPEAGGEVAVQLHAIDADMDHLSYELVDQPAHGRLSGTAPDFVYLPNADFPGTDTFSFLVRDGKSESGTATLVITGPNLSAKTKETKEPTPQLAQKTAVKPAIKPVAKSMTEKLGARDVVMQTDSTDQLLIDWLAIWREAGNGPAVAGASPEIDAANLHGRLEKIDAWHSRYLPPEFYEGEDILSYRFRKDKRYSASHLLSIKVALGDRGPEINLAPLADSFLSGQKVVLDARATMDESREQLHFIWRQLSGVPVLLKDENPQGSVASFIMPSVFAADRAAGLVIELTVVDAGGNKATRDIHLWPVSKRASALWQVLTKAGPGGMRSEGIALVD